MNKRLLLFLFFAFTVVYSFSQKKIEDDGFVWYNTSNLITSSEGAKNKNKTTIIPQKFFSIHYSTISGQSRGYFNVCKHGLGKNRWGIYDIYGNELIPPQYELIYYIDGAFHCSGKEEKTIYISFDNEGRAYQRKNQINGEVVSGVYNEKTWAIVKNGDYYGVISMGNFILPCKYLDVYLYKEDSGEEGSFVVTINDGGIKKGVYSLNGECIVKPTIEQAFKNSHTELVQVQSTDMANTSTVSEMSGKKKELSDVDIHIPLNPTNNENTFAIIFANENYQEESKVDFAHNDGEVFSEYCNKVLGLPEDNIHLRKDATLNNIRKEIDWITEVAKAYDGNAHIIIYYAGHGVPDEKTGSCYLLPIDGSGSLIMTGYSLDKLYKELGDLPVKDVVVFLDACFSGSERGYGMLASARGVAIKSKLQSPRGKMVVFSAAQGDETAYPYKEKGHGLFTYYLLKKLQETNGNVSLQELGDYLTTSVKRKSIVSNEKSQTPTVYFSVNVADIWKSMKLIK